MRDMIWGVLCALPSSHLCPGPKPTHDWHLQLLVDAGQSRLLEASLRSLQELLVLS